MDDKSMEELERSILESDQDRALDAYAEQKVAEEMKEPDLDAELNAMADAQNKASEEKSLDAELNEMASKKMDEMDKSDSVIKADDMKKKTGASYKKFISGALDFNGRTSRADFWPVVITNAAIVIILGILAVLPLIGGIFGWAASVIALILLVPSLSLTARRLIDAGYCKWLILLLLTGVGIIPLIYWCTRPSLPDKSED